ncbi:hypothetical protein [Streptomyces sp. enrichment culture]|uniref:hypothetical protein n=1 Tax=Streptomyces sp. enrichment culture TaxID=1795815 RepID=UPI003F574855
MSPGLPAVAPSVTAELVAALSPRLRKRLDAGVAKLSGRPVVVDGDTVRLAVDDDTDLELHAPGGVVTDPDAIRCGCLLAPDCLHRAAAASAAPIADEETDGASAAAEPATGPATGPGAASGARAEPRPRPQPEREPQPQPHAEPEPGQQPHAEPEPGPQPHAQQQPHPRPEPHPAPHPHPEPQPHPPRHPEPQSASQPAPTPDTATPAQHTAAKALRTASARVLDAGTDGAGAVLQAELLRAAHSARLAGLPTPAASAVSAVTRLRAARAADPSYRLSELVTTLRHVLSAAHRIPRAVGPELRALCGSARQPYRPDGSLRLYGLFCEPVLTTTGYAGAVTWTADADGRLYTVSDVAPGGPSRAAGAADRAVRMGDTALTHRELSRAGLAVSGATVSPTGRLGAGAAVRAVRASGAAWDAAPLDRLWAVPAADQAVRALADDARHDLLFLDVTLVGTVREAAGDCLLAECDGLAVRLAAAHDHPALAHRDNLRLLAAARGSRLRVVARLLPAAHPRAQLLAVSHPTDPGARLDLGLDRLRRADLPERPQDGPAAVPSGLEAAPVLDEAVPDEAPVHLLRRRVHQAVSGGRRALAFPGDAVADSGRLRRYGLATAAELLDKLHASAADRTRDAFGRLLPADHDRFARAWLAAAQYTAEVDRALCAAAWGADDRGSPWSGEVGRG